MKGSDEQNAASVFRELPVFSFLEHKADCSNRDLACFEKPEEAFKKHYHHFIYISLLHCVPLEGW